MAINLNKGGEEKPKFKFNLSKSPEPEFLKPGEIEGSTAINENSKGKRSRLLLFSLLGIICVAGVIWFVTNKGKSSEQKNAGMEQLSAKDQPSPNAVAPSNSAENVNKTGNTNVATNNSQTAPVSQTQSSTEAKPAQNVKEVSSKTDGQSIPVNANLPYKKNESYQVYLFPFGDSSYSQPNPELDKLAETLKQNPELKISITAYTDDIGDAEFNMSLSELRAKSIRNYLVNKGIDAGRMKYQGKGISTKYPTKAENRRAEFIIS